MTAQPGDPLTGEAWSRNQPLFRRRMTGILQVELGPRTVENGEQAGERFPGVLDVAALDSPADVEVIRPDPRVFRQAGILVGEPAPRTVDRDDPAGPVDDRDVGPEGIQDLLRIGGDAHPPPDDPGPSPRPPTPLRDPRGRRRTRMTSSLSFGGRPFGGADERDAGPPSPVGRMGSPGSGRTARDERPALKRILSDGGGVGRKWWAL